jgi:hypothetical protein
MGDEVSTVHRRPIGFMRPTGGGNRGPVGPKRETEVQDAIATRLAHDRAADGSYRLQDEFRFLIARA